MDACECSRLISELDYIVYNRRATAIGSRSSVAIHLCNPHICWENPTKRTLIEHRAVVAYLRNHSPESHSYHNIETRMNISLILLATNAPGLESKNRTLARHRTALRVSIPGLAAHSVQIRGR